MEFGKIGIGQIEIWRVFEQRVVFNWIHGEFELILCSKGIY